MDGVLVNSTKYIWKSFNILLKDEGVHFSDDYARKNIARSLRDNLNAWKEEFGIKYDLMEFSKKAGTLQLEMLKNEKPSRGLLNLLENAKTNKIKSAVGTASVKWRAEKILKLLEIEKYFDTLVTAEDTKNHKPHPDIFLEAAKRMEVKPEECIVIEDSGKGIEAAHRGNMKAIGLITEYNSSKELNHADLVIKDFSEISIDKLKTI